MEELGKQIAETIIEQSAKTIGLFPGSFSPATKGHFEVAKRAAQHVDEFHIIISNNIREGYTPEVSLKVWKQYLPLLPENVKVKIAVSNSPITEIYNIVKDKTNNYLVIFGKGEKNRYNSINENRDKYSNVDVIDAGNFDDISATSLREAIRTRNKLAIKSLIPEGIKVDDFLMNFQIHEIKVNTPGSKSPTDIIILIQNIKSNAKDKSEHEYLEYVNKIEDILDKYGDVGAYSTTRMFLSSINQNDLNKIYKEYKSLLSLDEEKIPGGLAQGMTLQDIADKHKANISSLRKQLQKGIKVELEHTTSKDVAEEIAMDHLFEDPKYYDKLATIENDTLDEAKSVGDVYHFTNLNGLENILKSNKFLSSKVPFGQNSPDFKSFRKKESDYNGKGIEYLNYFSTTRNKNLWKGDPKIGGSLARIKLDGNKLSNTYKIQPFYYYSDEMDNTEIHPKISQDESEERINLGTKKEIPNAQNYIKEIDVFLDKLGDNTRVLNLIQELQTKYPQVKTLYKDKEMSVEQYISDVLPTIEPYHNVAESVLLKENIEVNPKLYIQLLDKLTTECCEELGIEKPKVYIINNPKYTEEHKSYAGYIPSTNEIKLVIHGRSCADSCRSLSHELKHAADASQGLLTPNSGKDNDDAENRANSYAGGFLRKFGRENPNIYFLRYE